MAIEIRELVIKTTIHRHKKATPDKGSDGQEMHRLKAEIIEECIDKMKEMLQERLGRNNNW